MRPNNNNTNNKRSRGRNNNSRRSNGGGNNRSQVFDSNGPDVRIRGTAHQVNEKYMALAKDATSVGDWVLAESYFQHAEHYQRLINGWNREDEQQRANEQAQAPQQNNDDDNHNAKQASESAPKPQRKKQSRKTQEQEDELSLPDSILTPVSRDQDTLQDA